MSGQNPGDADEKAAAMDALNLDDLFLGGDDDEQGVADSLFADMDIDLGDIMDGIIGEAGGNMSEMMSEEFGGVDGVASQVAGSGPGSLNVVTNIGPADVVAADIIGPPLSSSSAKTKNRTARSNPFLEMARQQQEQEQRKAKQQAASRPQPASSNRRLYIHHRKYYHPQPSRNE
mmetsp:Transcript_12069/g.21208  ORF Transcript_12069/g.21208 Transcript_12069/m.21208 type:complete len:175 (-) Transcript_12069:47-571(-)